MQTEQKYRTPTVTLFLALTNFLSFLLIGSTQYIVRPKLDELYSKHKIGPSIANLLKEHCLKNDPSNVDCEETAQRAALYFLGKHYVNGIGAQEPAYIKMMYEPERYLSNLEAYPEYSVRWSALKKDIKKLANDENLVIGSNSSVISSAQALWHHGDMDHVMTNIFELIVFGFFLQQFISGVSFILIYLTGGTLSILIYSKFLLNDLWSLSGSSSGVYAILGALLIYLFINRRGISFGWQSLFSLFTLIGLAIYSGLLSPVVKLFILGALLVYLFINRREIPYGRKPLFPLFTFVTLTIYSDLIGILKFSPAVKPFVWPSDWVHVFGMLIGMILAIFMIALKKRRSTLAPAT